MSTLRANAIIDSGGGNTTTVNGVTITLSSQAQAEAGTDNTTQMTPLRVAQVALGLGQSWQNMSASRAGNTAYQNTSGRPIQVAISWDQAPGEIFQVSTDGVAWNTIIQGGNVGTALTNAQVVIPNLIYYRITGTTYVSWWELRA